jgi:uncharacterized protein (UPF0335 family)
MATKTKAEMALRQILSRVEGIDESDLTIAEKQIKRIAEEALAQRSVWQPKPATLK